jgi:hypothetical protein
MVADAVRLVRAAASGLECRCGLVTALVVVAETEPVVGQGILVVPLASTCCGVTAGENGAATCRHVRHGWKLVAVKIYGMGSERLHLTC